MHGLVGIWKRTATLLLLISDQKYVIVVIYKKTNSKMHKFALIYKQDLFKKGFMNVVQD
jgi:hypothetical protein